MGIKVLMLGGRGSGKSSVLAGMYDQLRHGASKDFFTTLDVTEYRKDTPLNESAFVSKQLELREALTRQLNTSFILDSNPNCCFLTYTLRMFIQGSFNKFSDVDLIDVPGSMLGDPFSNNSDAIKGLVSQSDVIVVTIDTPYLMEASGAVNIIVNCTDSLLSYLANIDSEKDKMVVFVPVKCEKWVKEGRINEVVERVKKDYVTSIRMLSAFPRMNICILPVETAGNILFTELREACVLNVDKQKFRCCKLTDNLVRLSDGKMFPLHGNEIMESDPESILVNSSISRPSSWFHINPDSNAYEPHNCDQLMLHILSFVKKSLSADFESRVKEIERAGLIMNGEESIVYLKKEIQ